MSQHDEELGSNNWNSLRKPLELRPEEPPLKDWERVLDTLSQEMEVMDIRDQDKDIIRATLLANFGDTRHNRYGFVIEDEGTTSQMLIEVLRQLTKEAA